MYYVIFSKDAYLLARFCTELQMEGYFWRHRGEDWFEENANPFFIAFKWLKIYRFKRFAFLNHGGIDNSTNFTLTSRNYTKVLEAVLTNKNKVI